MHTKPELLVTKPFHGNSIEYIKNELGIYFNITIPDCYSEASLSRYITKADFILGYHISEPLLRQADNLKYFQCVSSGLDHLPLELFRELNIEVGNSRSHAPHVAKFALGLMLNIACKISLNDNLLRQSLQNSPILSNPSLRMSPLFFSEFVGLIGYGAINRYVAHLLEPFDSKVLYYRKTQDPSSSSLNKIFSHCKYIFVALPLNEQTRNLVNQELLLDNPMSPYVVNVGRAEVIDRKALIKALRSNTISGFASDVAYGQDSSSPHGFDGLYDYPNVILSPHRAASTFGIPSYLPGAIAKLVKVCNYDF